MGGTIKVWRIALRAVPALVSTLCASGQDQWKQLPPLPDPLGVAAPFAGSSGGALLVAGGANFPNGMPWEGGKKVWHDRIWALDAPDGQWRDAGKLPRPLAYGVCARYNDGIICLGGGDADRHYADAFRLDWKTGKVAREEFPSLPIPLANHCGSVTMNGERLMVACGAEEPGEKSAINRVFAYNLRDRGMGTWQELERLPGKPRILAVAAAYNTAFYVIGGVALEPQADGKIARVYLRDMWRFTPTEGWKHLADLPKPIAAAPSRAPVIDGKIHIFAGDDGSLTGFTPVEKHPGFPKTVLTYDIAANTWSEAGEVPAPRATVPCVWWQNRIVFPSGEVRPGVRSPEVWTLRASAP